MQTTAPIIWQEKKPGKKQSETAITPLFQKPFQWENLNGNLTREQIKRQQIVSLLLAAFQSDFNVTEACDAAGISRETYYQWVKQDAELSEMFAKARRFPLLRAKQRGFQIIDKGNDRDAGPMLRWLLEKRQPETYGLTDPAQPGLNNTQNNYFFLTNEQLTGITKQPAIAKSSPTELLEALEAKPELDNRGKEGRVMDIHQEEVRP